MSIIFIIWVVALVALNVANYFFWLSIKDLTGTGSLGDGLMFIVFTVILFIADVATVVALF